jgi:hypothetical protein
MPRGQQRRRDVPGPPARDVGDAIRLDICQAQFVRRRNSPLPRANFAHFL